MTGGYLVVTASHGKTTNPLAIGGIALGIAAAGLALVCLFYWLGQRRRW